MRVHPGMARVARSARSAGPPLLRAAPRLVPGRVAWTPLPRHTDCVRTGPRPACRRWRFSGARYAVRAVICGVDGCSRRLQPVLKVDPRDRDTWLYPECDTCGRPACDEHAV